MSPERTIDPGVQPERTALAWHRTAMAVAVGSLFAFRFLGARYGVPGFLLGILGLCWALVLIVQARSRLRAGVDLLNSVQAPRPGAGNSAGDSHSSGGGVGVHVAVTAAAAVAIGVLCAGLLLAF